MTKDERDYRAIAYHYADDDTSRPSAMRHYAQTGEMPGTLLDEIQREINWFKPGSSSHQELMALYLYIKTEIIREWKNTL